MGFAKVGIASLLVVAAQGGHDFTPEVFIVYPMQVVLSLNPSDSKYTTGTYFAAPSLEVVAVYRPFGVSGKCSQEQGVEKVVSFV